MTLALGKHTTRGGFKAVVAKLKSTAGTSWTLHGAIECPVTKTLVMTSWDTSGKCLDGATQFDICPDEAEAKEGAHAPL